MKHNEKYLTETLDILNRKFGDPLPTLEDTMKAHALKKEGELPPALKKAIAKKKGEEVKEGGPGSGRPAKPGGAKDIDNKMGKAVDDANARLDAAEKELKKKKKMKKEGADDVVKAKRVIAKLMKTESKFRKEMFQLEQSFLLDPRPENKKLATQIKKVYKDGVTKFMREAVQMIKRMK